MDTIWTSFSSSSTCSDIISRLDFVFQAERCKTHFFNDANAVFQRCPLQHACFCSFLRARKSSQRTLNCSKTSSKEGVHQKFMKIYQKTKRVHCENIKRSSPSTVVGLKTLQELFQRPPRRSRQGSKSFPTGFHIKAKLLSPKRNAPDDEDNRYLQRLQVSSLGTPPFRLGTFAS